MGAVFTTPGVTVVLGGRSWDKYLGSSHGPDGSWPGEDLDKASVVMSVCGNKYGVIQHNSNERGSKTIIYGKVVSNSPFALVPAVGGVNWPLIADCALSEWAERGDGGRFPLLAEGPLNKTWCGRTFSWLARELRGWRGEPDAGRGEVGPEGVLLNWGWGEETSSVYTFNKK